MEIYQYLIDIIRIENISVAKLQEKTGYSGVKLLHFLNPKYAKKSKMVQDIAAAVGLADPEIPIMERIAEYYCNKLHAILGSAEETFVKHYCALPAPEQRYLRIIARDIAGEYLSNKNGSLE